MNSRSKKKPSLFEAMSRGPLAPSEVRGQNPAWSSRSKAEPAAAVIDAPAAPAPSPTRWERTAAAAPVQRIEPREAERPAEPTPATRTVGVDQGRVVVSLTTVGCMVIAAAMCVLWLTGYSMGRRTAAGGQRPESVRALTPAQTMPAIVQHQKNRRAQRTRVEEKMGDADLSYLMQTPPARERRVEPIEAPPAANPLPAPASANKASGVGSKPLQYLQIESFRLSRGSSPADVSAEVEDVRRFLTSHGIETTARATSGGYVLMAARGFDSAKEPDAVEFRRQMQRLGREYRKSGGRYEFKGCFYVGEASLPGNGGGN